MKYRTKLYLAFVCCALASTCLAVGIMYRETKKQLFKAVRSQVLSIASTTAAYLDPNILEQIKTEADVASPAFREAQEILRKARNANRRGDIYVKYVYTLFFPPGDTNQLVFGVDAEMDPEIATTIGEIDLSSESYDLLSHLKELYAPDHFITDQWGVWLSGFAPVLDAKGNYVATVGVDIRASDVLTILHRLITYGISALAIALLAAFITAFFLARRATNSLSKICEGVEEIGHGHLETRTHLETADEFHDLAEAINAMAQGLQEKERLKINFAHYVSKYILEKILESEEPMKLEGERRKITVLFSDIRHFTELAEHLPPEQVVSLLNEYFERMIEVIFKNYGTLDKFLGDGIMVEFGAPLEDRMQEKHAVMAALQMQEEVEKLRQKWVLEGKPTFKIGIGIHTGIAIVGNVGSEQRMEYTAIGDTVNVASRIEQATKELHSSILVSEMTQMAIKKDFPFISLGPISLKGKKEQIHVYTLETSEKL